MHPSYCRHLAKLGVSMLLLLGALPGTAFTQIIGFFPAVDSISVVGSCTPPSLTCHVIDVVGGIDTVDIRPMWDDRMYAGAPFGAQISNCFFVVADSFNTNQYQLRLTSFWPDSGAYYAISFDSIFSVMGRFVLCLRVDPGGGRLDSGEAMFHADAVGAVESTRFDLPNATRLLPNFPNPFNATTTIRYQLDHTSNVTLAVYNILGQEVARLVSQVMAPGSYSAQFYGGDLSSGVYLCKLQAGDVIQSRKIISLK